MPGMRRWIRFPPADCHSRWAEGGAPKTDGASRRKILAMNNSVPGRSVPHLEPRNIRFLQSFRAGRSGGSIPFQAPENRQFGLLEIPKEFYEPGSWPGERE